MRILKIEKQRAGHLDPHWREMLNTRGQKRVWQTHVAGTALAAVGVSWSSFSKGEAFQGFPQSPHSSVFTLCIKSFWSILSRSWYQRL